MKQKIKEAITQGYKNLGVPESVVDGLTALGVTVVKDESEIDAFVQGEAVKGVMRSWQSEADKVRTKASESKKTEYEAKIAELEAKLNGNNPPETKPEPKPQDNPADMAKIIAEAVANAIKPISDELAGFKAEKTVNDTIAAVNTRIDAWGYGKGYPKEMEKARKNAMELYEAYGKKWSADELEAKIKEKFNQEVYDKGLDTTEPYDSDGASGGEAELDMTEVMKIYQKSGRVQGKE